jgi:hypothetical protein
MLALQIIMPTLAPLINKIMQKEGTVKFFNETKGFGFITPSAVARTYLFIQQV